jgi:ribonuclease-3
LREESDIRLGKLLHSLGRWLASAGESESKEPLDGLYDKLGYIFSDSVLLIQALKHRSYVYAIDEESIESNDRLEFLGDAVLDLVVTENLYRRFEHKREGDLTQVKSLLVSKVVLAQRGRELGLGNYLYLSSEEDLAGGRNRTSIIGDAFEALLGAIYLDGGLHAAERFVQRTLLCDAEEIISNGDYLNFKSVLLEHTQSEGHGHPRYLVNSEEGPDHRKVFTVEVVIGGDRMGLGRGRSKKEAQQMAAKEALKTLGVP